MAFRLMILPLKVKAAPLPLPLPEIEQVRFNREFKIDRLLRRWLENLVRQQSNHLGRLIERGDADRGAVMLVRGIDAYKGLGEQLGMDGVRLTVSKTAHSSALGAVTLRQGYCRPIR
jgi:hypothetical protein